MKKSLVVLLVMSVAAIAIAGCAPAPTTPTTPTTPTSTPTSTPSVTPSVSPTSTEPTKEQVPVSVFYSYQEAMQPVRRYAPAGTVGVLKFALESLLQGPTAEEKAAGLSSQIPTGTKLRSVKITGSTAVVDLTTEYGTGGGSLSMFHRIAQVVYTATQFKSVESVDLYMDGKKIEALGGEGLNIKHPTNRADWDGQSPAILVDDPAWGGVVREGMAIKGSANVFEAVFQLELRDSAGQVIYKTTVNATSGTGTRGTFSTVARLGTSTAKTGTLRVYSDSPKDGSAINIVEFPVVYEH